MRTAYAIIAGSALFAACSSGTRIVYVPAPVSAPEPAPAPVVIAPMPMPPVAVTIARVEDGRMLVSTNQPAYLAAFEIVPYRGATLVYPMSARQRQVALVGSNWLTVSRSSLRDDVYDREGRRDRDRDVYSTRHLYVIASERPLRLGDEAFNDEYLRNVLGPRASRAPEPYDAMAALARRFVPPGMDEEWGEDLYTVAVSRPTVVHVAKIYCPDGSVTYVRDDMAARASCPYRRDRSGGAPRPDSVVASNGRPITIHRPDSRTPPPVFRVPRPADEGPIVEQQGRPGHDGQLGQPGHQGQQDQPAPRRGWPFGNAPHDSTHVARSDSATTTTGGQAEGNGRPRKEHHDNGIGNAGTPGNGGANPNAAGNRGQNGQGQGNNGQGQGNSAQANGGQGNNGQGNQGQGNQAHGNNGAAQGNDAGKADPKPAKPKGNAKNAREILDMMTERARAKADSTKQ